MPVQQFNLPANMEAKVRLTYTNKDGGAARVDGAPVWTPGVNSDCYSVVVSEDGLFATITPNGKAGDAQLDAVGDADLGEGVRSLAIHFDIKCLGLEAENVGATVELSPLNG